MNTADQSTATRPGPPPAITTNVTAVESYASLGTAVAKGSSQVAGRGAGRLRRTLGTLSGTSRSVLAVAGASLIVVYSLC